MGPLITGLRSTTIQVQRLVRKQIAAIQQTVVKYQRQSGRELAHAIDEQFCVWCFPDSVVEFKAFCPKFRGREFEWERNSPRDLQPLHATRNRIA